MTERQREELSPAEQKENSKAVIAHVLPFAIWLTMMVWFSDYNARTIGGLILLAVFRPWRWYPKINWKNIPAGIGVGLLIFVVWVGLEIPVVQQKAPAVTEWYDRLLVDPFMNPFKTRELYEVPLEVESPEIREALSMGEAVERTKLPYEVIEKGEHIGLHEYDPKVTGWFAFWVHMFGSTVIIAIIEEFFYRGFLYRWMQGSPFFSIDAGKLHWPMLTLISLFFSVSHFEVGAAIICGFAYGLLYIKTRDIWAPIIAHGTTNFVLGLYVLKYGQYHFW
ncbi:CAAX prenyl protease-related protein [Pontiella sp.]|uniref:CAAX prenyl protease-related protein n=1 Tax=Pontiella sp. TaxID=2837462 RepID=UPI003562E9A1